MPAYQGYQGYQGATTSTPQEIARTRKLAEALMSEATDASPVQHWTQGLARVVKGGVGGYQAGQAGRMEMAGQQAGSESLARALAGGSMEDAASGLMANPYMAQSGMDLASKAIGNREAQVRADQQAQQQFERQKQLIDYKQSKETASGPSYGRSGGIFQAGNGQFYTVQFADDGSRKILPVTADGQALTPSKGVTRVGDELIDQATGQTVRGVGGSISGEQVAKIEGETEGKRRATFPKMQGTMRSLVNQWGVVKSTIDSVLPRINDQTAGLIGTAAGMIPGTAAYDVQRDLETIKANIGFDKLGEMRENSPTGASGLGQVTEFENRLLQAVNGALEPGQSAPQLRERLSNVRDLLEKVHQEKMAAFQETYGDLLKGGASRAPSGRQVPPEAIELLRADPSRAQQFDEVFGQGAAQRVLNGG